MTKLNVLLAVWVICQTFASHANAASCSGVESTQEGGYVSLNGIKGLPGHGKPMANVAGFADCCNHVARDCLKDGVHSGRVNGAPVPLYCEPKEGWTVIQRRVDGLQTFAHTWNSYAKGFGDLKKEFWLGNDNIAAITNSGPRYELRIDMEDFNGLKKYALYSDFKIGTADDKYKLKSLGAFSGNVDDYLTKTHLNEKFGTYDQDNDQSSDNCGEQQGSGWWFNNCYDVNLNGGWNKTAERGINWYDYQGDKYATNLKSTTMKIRPAECPQ
jgi:ficolin